MSRLLPLLAAGLWIACPIFSAAAEAELLEVRKIWDAAPHNAFTDLIRFRGRWQCVFREGKGHVSPDGAIRIIESADGTSWKSKALIQDPKADLRDPKITLTPDGQLMLSGAGAYRAPPPVKHQSFVWFSTDGEKWSEAVPIGDPDMWLWRISWHRDKAYSIGYDTSGDKFVRLYGSKDGRAFEPIMKTLFDEGQPNESSLLFLPDDTCLCLLRRDGNPGTGKLGRSRSPFTEWTWKDLGVKIGGPHWLRLPDGRFVAAVRLYGAKVRTSLAWIDPDSGKLSEFLKLPSGGDSSYAGLVWHEELLWVSYYSSHEGKTSIYLAKIKLLPPKSR